MRCAPNSAGTRKRRAEGCASRTRGRRRPRCGRRHRCGVRGAAGPGPRAKAHGRSTFAVSGRHTPWARFARLAPEDVPWEHVAVFQVDERVVPDGDPDRNLRMRRPPGILLASAPGRRQNHGARPHCRAGSVRRMRWLRTRRTFPRTCWSFSGSLATSRER
ncbi:6-phosphogluconolactonase [Streptomyces sp. NPDC007157]|uniref:6-phosphogluconolactonase n=1 Tax=Streptomyces sp. NPDC007157 TaxID=3154681 RepID=UPI0033D3BD40